MSERVYRDRGEIENGTVPDSLLRRNVRKQNDRETWTFW